MVYVPNWFSVDLKTGVNDKSCNRDIWKVYVCRHLNKDLITDLKHAFVCLLNRCSPSRWTRVIASLPGCLQRTLGFQAPMGPTQSVRMPGFDIFHIKWCHHEVESYTDLLSLLLLLQWISVDCFFRRCLSFGPERASTPWMRKRTRSTTVRVRFILRPVVLNFCRRYRTPPVSCAFTEPFGDSIGPRLRVAVTGSLWCSICSFL